MSIQEFFQRELEYSYVYVLKSNISFVHIFTTVPQAEMFSIRSDIEDATSCRDLDEIKKDIQASIDENHLILSKLLASVENKKKEITPIAVRLQYLYKVEK